MSFFNSRFGVCMHWTISGKREDTSLPTVIAAMTFFTACFCTSKSVRRSSSRHSAISPRKEQSQLLVSFTTEHLPFRWDWKKRVSPAVMRPSLTMGDGSLSREAISDETDRKLSSKLFFSAFLLFTYSFIFICTYIIRKYAIQSLFFRKCCETQQNLGSRFQQCTLAPHGCELKRGNWSPRYLTYFPALMPTVVVPVPISGESSGLKKLRANLDHFRGDSKCFRIGTSSSMGYARDSSPCERLCRLFRFYQCSPGFAAHRMSCFLSFFTSSRIYVCQSSMRLGCVCRYVSQSPPSTGRECIISNVQTQSKLAKPSLVI